MKGARVVRGPDWKWGDQDGGEGGVGTILSIGCNESNRKTNEVNKQDDAARSNSSDVEFSKIALVLWDNGFENNYRVGFKGAYDLRLFDNGPTGIKHKNIICDSCRKQDIYGMRFKCSKCYDFDLCQICYMLDRHDLSHPFILFESVDDGNGISVGPRVDNMKIPFKGLFIGARIIKGKNWVWGNQDGGEGKTGRIVGYRDWNNETGRSVVTVTWTATGVTNVYRVGHLGLVDVKCVEPAIGGTYYRDHLPIIGMSLESLELNSVTGRGIGFQIGDKVKVGVDCDLLQKMQDGHCGWNPKMKDIISVVGTVYRITKKGDIRVMYEGNVHWTLNPAVLMKVGAMEVGDVVRLIGDAEKIKRLQIGHGEWVPTMEAILSKVGHIVQIYSDGDLRVFIKSNDELQQKTWTLNPLCVKPVIDSNYVISKDDADEVIRLFEKFDLPSDTSDKLIKETAMGNIEYVKDFLAKHPDKVDCFWSNKTCLQVACHQGPIDMVCYLLLMGADLNMKDEEGDTPLHYAAFGNQPDIMSLLIQRGASINVINKGKSTPLHISIAKQYFNCVKVLLKHNCDVNVQDAYGDTAIHEAIVHDSNGEIIEVLIHSPGIDLSLTNKRGFNPLHVASHTGKTIAAEMLLITDTGKTLIDVRKDDGFAPLHLASLTGHKAVIDILLRHRADINILNNRLQTPLMLAASQGHSAVVEFLISSGCDLNLVDNEGDNCLHIVIGASLKKNLTNIKKISETEAPTIFGIYNQLQSSTDTPDSKMNKILLAIACYLTQEGCSLERLNNKQQPPIEIIEDELLRAKVDNILKRYVMNESDKKLLEQRLLHLQWNAQEGGCSKMSECTICSELSEFPNVLLEPCQHRIACDDCSSRLKKCIKCHELIEKRIAFDGRLIEYSKNGLVNNSTTKPQSYLRYLQTKISEYEELQSCSICMERRKNVAFLCGHGACDKCSATLRICHMCRKPITKTINLY